jgi:hypothetical protein
MRLVKQFTRFVSGSRKSFQIYAGCVATSIEEFYTTNDKHMMKVIVDGKSVVGQYNEQIFNIIEDNLDTPAPFVFYNLTNKITMIACIPDMWEDLDLVKAV